ncbi:MAG: hypothetical protein FJ267_16020, partial [Planctomycetes bacterium]|nr:hypothetical protein [Planctomycetota bacterium]
HPDFLFVGCPEGKREIPIDAMVGSKEQRGREGLCHDLSVRPLAGSRKVAVIDGADLMNEASANALLKTLEEPPDRAVILMIASNLDAVLTTIRSRCQLVRFSPLSTNDVSALLLEGQLVATEQEARFAAELSEGSLTVARQLLDPELCQLRSRLYESLAQPAFSGIAVARGLFEIVDKISADTSEQRVNIHWLIRFAVEFYRSALARLSCFRGGASFSSLDIPEAATLASRLDRVPDPIELIGSLIDRAVTAASHIDQNITVALGLEAFLSDLSHLLQSSRVSS